MSVEDKKLARDLTRELYRKRHLDLSDVRVSVSRNIGYIGGVIKASIGETINAKEEIKSMMDMKNRVPGVREIVVEAKFNESSKR